MLGFFIAGTILFLSRGGSPGPCGEVNAGSLTDLVPRATIAPSFVAFGGNCQYWLAMRDSRLVADQADDRVAALHRRLEAVDQPLHAAAARPVDFAELDYYPTSYGTGAFKGSWIVDFGDVPATTTTT